jgi:hypothetical protein
MLDSIETPLPARDLLVAASGTSSGYWLPTRLPLA